MTIEEENRQLRARVTELEKELRLTTLRRQVTPHFLFNSISVAIDLVMTSPRTGVRFLRRVASMYRYLLEYGDRGTAPVEQELQLAEQYFELMSIRHVGCLHLTVTPAVRSLRGYPLPPLSLQGLIENAIKHNVHMEDEPLAITISLSTEGEGLSLVVSNPIKRVRSDASSSPHFGLAYIRETMQLLYGRDISISDNNNIFTVNLPLIGDVASFTKVTSSSSPLAKRRGERAGGREAG